MLKLPNFKRIERYFLEHRVALQILAWSKRRSLPGFAGVPVFDVAVFLSNEIRRFDLFTRANSIAFSFFLALFPSIIVLISLIPYLIGYFTPDIREFNAYLQTEITRVLPGNAGRMLFTTIEDLATKQRGDLLSFSFLLAILFASNGMLSLMRGFDKTYESTFRKRGYFERRSIAIGLTLLLGVLLIVSVVLVILGNQIIAWLSNYIHFDWFSRFSLTLLSWLTTLILYYSVISIIYRYGPATHRKFSYFSPGTNISVFLSIFISLLFSFYIDNFGTYNKLYGSIGTIIVLMLWIQLNALVLLVGFELNVSIAVNRDLKVQMNDKL